MLNPFTALALGSAIGFAIIVPYGGLRLGQKPATGNSATHVVSCDIMGCTVRPLKAGT